MQLKQSENVKHFVASYNSANNYRKNKCYANNHYVLYHELAWNKPNYKPEERLPRIPTEERINMIISASPLKPATRLSISRETGLRPMTRAGLIHRE